MQNKRSDLSETMNTTAETVANTIITVLDKLAGQRSNLKLSFEDLTFDSGMLKAKVNGAVVLDVIYSQPVATKE
jgi:hypothetical protein